MHRPKVHQGVGQNNLMSSPIPPICLLDKRPNGGIYVQIGSVWIDSRTVYAEIALRRERLF